MAKRALSIASVILAAGLASPAPAKTCRPDDPAQTSCTLQVERLRPTQFAVGSIAVDCKADGIARRSKKKLKKYLQAPDREVPAVVGPDGNFYITDHHHLATAVYRAKSKEWGDDDKLMRVKIIANHDAGGVSLAEFWEGMQRERLTYNSDNKGIPDMNFALLPTTVGGLLNDPYRTLSRWVREGCGYVKLGKTQCDDIRTDHPHEAPYFMEFYWGEFFRQQLPLTVAEREVCKSIPYSSTCLADEVGQLKSRYAAAMKLAASEAAMKYFVDLKLDPWAYGYNPSARHVPLTWTGDDLACEATDAD